MNRTPTRGYEIRGSAFFLMCAEIESVSATRDAR